MTQIIKEGGKTIVKTGQRIDTLNAAQFETDIQPALEQGVDLEIDCTENVWMMEEVLMETGLFEKITDEERLHSPDRNMAGDIYTAESRHTIMQVSDGKDVENR